MALKNKSEIDVIQGPEFINLQPLDINPLMQQCEIKVFYLGHNRNGSYINRETALEMAKTLRGTPIVAAYNKDKEDFGDHGHIMHIEDGEITFSVKTIPYGFVAPNAEVWFQNFKDTDEFGNTVERTYLMTTGYLWSGQFEELTKVINEGQPQSMELDSDSLQGHWATDNNLGVDFFIINDATFSKLCILGDNVEPCYEGASVTSPEVSKNFTQGQEFQQTLFTMMNDLQTALNSEGGLNMSEEKELLNESVDSVEKQPETNCELVEETVEETPSIEENEYSAVEEEETLETEKTDDTDVVEETAEEITEEFVDKKKEEDDDDSSDDKDEDESDEDEDEDKKDRPKNQHSLEEFEALQAELDSLRAEIQELREFKLNIENQQKDALIASYYMLSDEDKADIVAHKAEFTLEEIKAKLAVIYVEKNVNFDMIESQEEEETVPAMTFSLDEEASEGVPAFVEALRHTLK